MSLTRFSLLLIVLLGMTACSEDDPATMKHYFNPVWTPDGTTLVAGYLEAPTGPVVPGQDGVLAVMDLQSRMLRTVALPGMSTVHTLYCFDPSGTALAFVKDGTISFFDLSGNTLLTHVPSEGGTPEFFDFSNTGNSFVWAGKTAEGYDINLTTYDAAGWLVQNQITLISLETTAGMVALTMTGQRSVAVRFDDGMVYNYDFDGSLLHTFMLTPFENVNPWQQRLIYSTGQDGTRLYARDAGGLHLLDLAAGSARQIVYGQVVDLDVSGGRRSMVYETSTGDTWSATMEGLPLVRLEPQTIMPRYSPANNALALIHRLDGFTDSLLVARLAQ